MLCTSRVLAIIVSIHKKPFSFFKMDDGEINLIHCLLLDGIADPTPLIEQEACRARYFLIKF
jgi:hypothetical protein